MHPPVNRNRFIPPGARVGFRLAACSLGVLLAAQAGAQSTPNAASKDEPVVLSPFEVSTNHDIGYQANDTLAGSRLRTNLTDVANAISVFTPELMQDLNAFGESDLMRYSASAEPERTDQTASAQGISIDTGGFQYRIRGQLASRSRNYFSTALVPDTYNAERFEEARGPNAILFGLGGAGGILNITTKTARTSRTFSELMMTAGSGDMLRTQLDHNQRINDRLALRFNGVYQTAHGWQEHQSGYNRRMHLAATYRPVDKVTVRLEAEYGHVENTLTRFFAPFDNVSLWKLSGSPLVASGIAPANAAVGIGKRNATPRVTFIGNDDSLHNFQQTVFSQALPTRTNSVILPGDWSWISPGTLYPQTAAFSGPGGTSELKQKLFGATVVIEPIHDLNIELAAINDLRDQDVYDTTNEVYRVLGEPGQTYRDGAANPYAGDYYVDTRWVLRRERNSGERYRATVSYQLDLGKIWGRHNFAGMVSRDDTGNPRSVGFLVLNGAPFNSQPQNAANQIWTRQYVTNPNDPSQFAAPDFRRVPSQFSVVMDPGAAPRTFNTNWADNELNDQWQHVDNRFAALQSYFADDRIVTTVGYRYTKQTSYVRPTNATLPSFSNSPLMFLGPATGSEYDFERLSYGIVAKPVKAVSLYYNYSENAQIPGSTQTLIPNSSPFPLNSGVGKDYGVMLRLLDGRVFVRAGYFTTSSQDQAAAYGASNVAVRNDRIMDAELAAGVITPAQAIRFSGGDWDLADVDTKGYEVNVTANLTPNWRVMVSLSKSTAVTSNMLKRSRPAAAQVLPLWQLPAAQALVTTAGITVAQEIANYQSWLATTTAVEGKGTVGHREDEARVFTRYDFKQSFLKGFFVGGGFSYGSSPVIGRSTAGGLFYAPIRREADALVGYKTRLPHRLGGNPIEFQFNATNLLQQSPYVLMDQQPDGQYFRAQLQAPTQYAFTTRISF